MPKYRPIKIMLNEQEDAEVYYQKVCGKNAAIRCHARILYYAGQGTDSMKELCEKAECDYATARLLLERYEKDGMMAIYQCKRGKRPCQLDAYAKEIEEELDRHPAKSVSEVVIMLKEKFGITITATPVRDWLKKRGIPTKKQEQCQQKQMKKSKNISSIVS